MPVTINGTTGVDTPSVASTNITYTGTLTGGTGVINIGSGQLVKDASGNLGLGVTPSAWGGGRRILQMPNGAAFGDYSGFTGLSQNYYNNGTSDLYIANGFASRYLQGSGQHLWYTAASGTAGNTISFTQAMTLDASSNLTIAGATATKASGTTWANPSDVRLKENVSPYMGGLPELLQVNVKTWKYNGKGGTTPGARGLGVIADEIMQVLPQTVDTYSAKLNADDEEETDIKRFDATEITWLLVNAVKELNAKVEALEARLASDGPSNGGTA